MTTLEALLKVAALLTFIIANYFISLEAVTLYANTSNINAVRCIEKERQALLKFKYDSVDPSGFLSTWVGSDCCTWKGVGCRYPTGEVVKLDLSNSKCYSEYYWEYLTNSSCLGGKLSHYLNELEHLSYLNLSYNSFSGMIPPEIGNLSNLHSLDLRSFGNSWVSDLNWLSGLSSLKFLDLSYVNLSLATTHWLQAINSIPSLVELRLAYTGLRTIPLSLARLNLTSLSVLDLSRNNFSSQAPQWLFNISSSLVFLKLWECNFRGPISSILGGSMFRYGHSNLEELDLSYNQFSGQLPDSLGHLKSLRTLDLSSNSISGPLPDSLGHLKSLRTLDLYSNSISGPLPTSLGELSKLEELILSSNKMNGSVPKTLGRLRELKSLDLFHNDWEGVLSQDYFEGLSKLEALSISSLNGGFILNLSRNWVPPFSLRRIAIEDYDLGPEFPLWLQTQTQLEDIVLQNVSISDTIPSWLWKMSPHINRLVLSHNRIGGTIPISPLVFPSEAWIDLSSNLILANNSFSGTIPINIGQIMSTLRYLDLSENLLNGSIPSSLGKNKMMDTIDLSKNNLSGKFPATLCSLPNLFELKLGNNRLFGKLPFSLKNCKGLALLDVGENKFSGSIPKWIGESLLSLRELRMRGNLFTGSVSKQLCRLQELHILVLAENNLSGPIPTCLSNLSAMKSRNDVVYPRSNMELVLKGSKYTYDSSVLPLVKLIDLSCNNLSGYVSEDITNLVGLGTLNLSNNHLTGEIPQKIGEMKNLETLDLSSNRFSGQIPPSMSSMTFLSHLNLSHNNFSGPIPSGNQFLTFDKSIYEGNLGLCGSPLPIKCKASGVEEDGDYHWGHDEDKKEDKNKDLGLFVSIALGFVVGFWSVCGSLVIKKSWRDAYFGFLKKMNDWIIVAVAVNVNHLLRMIARNKN